MMRTRAPVLAALALLLALAGAAQATVINNISVTYDYPGLGDVYSGVYIGPYALTLSTNPAGGSGTVQAMPCINAKTEAGPPYSWKADAYSGADIPITGVDVPLTGSPVVNISQQNAWECWYLSSMFGTWSNGNLTPGPTTNWPSIHWAIWDETGTVPYADPGGGAGYAAVADTAWTTEKLSANSAKLAADLANFWVLVPQAAVGSPPLVPQPFLVAKSNWQPPVVTTPEPSTWALLLLGMALLGMACLKQRRAKA